MALVNFQANEVGLSSFSSSCNHIFSLSLYISLSQTHTNTQISLSPLDATVILIDRTQKFSLHRDFGTMQILYFTFS